jgi:hypothetical protein
MIKELLAQNLKLTATQTKSHKPMARPDDGAVWNLYDVMDMEEAYKQNPNMNISINCSESGLVQVDPDSPEATNWAVKHGLTSENTWIIRSRRGLKALFKAPDIQLPSAYTDGTHATSDIGSWLCLAPPSIHPKDHSFTLGWFKDHSPSDIPYRQLHVLPESLLNIWQELKTPKHSNIVFPSHDTISGLHPIYEAIVNRIEHTSRLRPNRDGGMEGLCPLHDDKNPSFGIHPVKGWKCFSGCGEGRITELAVRLGIYEVA